MALFKTTEEIQNYLAVDTGENIKHILPDIKWAEERYIIPAIGQAQYDDLNDAYNEDPQAMTEAQERLLEKVQMPLIHLAYSKAFIVAQVHIDAVGISITSDSNRKTAFQWQIEELKEDYAAEKGFNGLDFLLAFLENNKSDYPLWENSDAFTITRQFFINSTVIFNQIVNIGNSRRTFLALWPGMTTVEELQLEPVLGAAFYQELKAKILAGTLSNDEKALVDKIQKPVAFFTAAESIYDMPLRIRAGSLVLDSLKSGSENIKDRRPAEARDLEAYSGKQKEKAGVYIGRLKDYLQATASPTVFATFYASELYIHPEERAKTYTNNPDSSQFSL